MKELSVRLGIPSSKQMTPYSIIKAVMGIYRRLREHRRGTSMGFTFFKGDNSLIVT